jgi:hypothetical protein
MSRRWYRHGNRQIFVGWDRSLQSFFLTIASLCPHCQGSGEEPDSDYFCGVCGGEGVQQGAISPIQRAPAMTLDEMATELAQLAVPFPDYVRADLEQDQRTNVGELVYEYDLEARGG